MGFTLSGISAQAQGESPLALVARHRRRPPELVAALDVAKLEQGPTAARAGRQRCLRPSSAGSTGFRVSGSECEYRPLAAAMNGQIAKQSGVDKVLASLWAARCS